MHWHYAGVAGVALVVSSLFLKNRVQIQTSSRKGIEDEALKQNGEQRGS